MSIVLLADLQREARKNGYAVPHFLGGNLEMILAAITAAERNRSPVALGFASEVFYMIPMDIAIPAIVAAAEKSSVPVAIQLEHGNSYEQIASAIRCGLNSVMFDGSHLPYEENVRETAEITKMAHAFGASVEAELGNVGGTALVDIEGTEGFKTDPQMVTDFISRTSVDSLAISFGNFHGRFRDTPHLDYALVEQIAGLTDTPLTMHGGSGFSREEYKRCVRAGISNIHFYTYITLGLWKELQEEAARYDNQPVYHQIAEWTINYFEHKISEAMDSLNSLGKAP